MTQETRGTVGAWKDRPATVSRKAASIGSISGEWKAWLTARGRVRCPAAESSAVSSDRGSRAPDRTTERGPLTAATATSWVRSASRGRTSASEQPTATMVPPGGSARISRPRAATRAQASRSESTPAT